MTNTTNEQNTYFQSLEEATGKIPYRLTNDYMFRAVLQKSKIVLHGLIGSLLHLTDEEMISVEITNPIILGEAIESKEYRLDIDVLLNNNTRINLEMQVSNYYNWENRSLSYLCREFDQLSKGSDYSEIHPVIHISILDYTLFPNHPEFYACYKLMNMKNHYIYNDNFTLNVLDLTQIKIATDEDKSFQIDYWAKLLKSTTWEELKNMASNNSIMQEACNVMFQLSSDEKIRKLCRDREDYYADLRGMQKKIAEKDETIADQASALAEKDETIANQASALAKKEETIAAQANALTAAQAEIERLKAQIQQNNK